MEDKISNFRPFAFILLLWAIACGILRFDWHNMGDPDAYPTRVSSNLNLQTRCFSDDLEDFALSAQH